MRRFKLTTEHLQLLRHANVRWEDCEFGAPAIDCKRPYGNSDVISDVSDILGIDNREGENTNFFRQLHAETETALQIVLATGEFEAGSYVCDDYKRNWRLA